MPCSSRPNVLYLTHRLPYPPDKGDRIRNYHILDWLARRASVHLASLADEHPDEAAVGTLQGIAARVAVVRLRRTSRWARAAWSLVAGRTATEGAFYSQEFADVVHSWVTQTHYDVVLASASSLVPYLRLAAPGGIPAVVDFVDVDSQKWLDYAATGMGPRAWLYRTEGERLRRLERDATKRARAVLLVSAAEVSVFRAHCDSPNVYVVPNGVDLETFCPDAEPAESARSCVFVGALDYRPNIDGICWFCREAWPEIRRRSPAAQLRVVGRRPVSSVRRLAAIPGVEVVGQVADVRPYVASAGVVVVPLRLARGVQNKVLEALAMGKATVASPQSLAGLQAEGSVPVLAATTREEWVASVVQLMDDAALRARLGRDGRRFVEESRRWDRCLEPLEAILGLRDKSLPAPATQASWA